ncbi:MAG: ribosomal protein S18-alanine N-acetyltransferase [bacterium]|nr:ribosomal protein S18-alanine N-acetyltransferase [bacterium]
MTGARESEQSLCFVPLEEEHLEGLIPIELEAYPEPWTLGMFRDEVRNNRSYFYVVQIDGVTVGYGGFWLVLDEAHITSVTIAEEWRGKGYGRRLTVFLLDAARKAGATLATLEVRMSNQAARDLYLSLGFGPVGVRKGYYPKSNEDAIVMLKELD